MVGHSLRALWNEPRPPSPPVRVWRDWVLVAVVGVGSLVEVVLRQDRARLVVVVGVSVVIALSLLWRRTHPLGAVLVAFGTLLAFDVARVVAIDATGLHSIAAALVLPYALFRWGAGRDAVLGLGVILAWLAVTHAADPTAVDEVVAGYGFFLFAAALGASIRFHASSRRRDIEQAELRQRNELARELHDAVGHHVSAIAVQAQAGRAVAATHPEQAVAALEVIEEAASRTLEEMRAMVGTLRDGSAAELAPPPGVADVARLARAGGHGPRVEVRLPGDLDGLSPAVATAIYRIAQEAVTNAIRHAHGATSVTVDVVRDADRVRLRVRDDGGGAASGGTTAGFGLLGMSERAALLGGDLRAGPDGAGGWTVEATLPTRGPAPARPHAAKGPA